MRKNLVAAGLLCIVGTAHYLLADASLEGPRLGYIATNAGVRSVIGIVGASRLGDLIARDLTSSVVLPGSDVAVGMKSTGELTRVNLRDGSESDMGISGVSNVAASPSGEQVLAVAGDHAYWFSKEGARIVDRELPSTPLLIAVADRGSAAAITVTEAGGEAVYLINDQGDRRVLRAARFTAIAFLPKSGDFVVADDSGLIHRIGIDLQLSQLTTLRGVKALAGTADGTRLLAVTGKTVMSLRFATQETKSVDCSCMGAMAMPLGGSTYLITNSTDEPRWVLDASSEELRLAFIPEAAND